MNRIPIVKKIITKNGWIGLHWKKKRFCPANEKNTKKEDKE